VVETRRVEMLKFIGSVVVAWWFLGIVAVALGGGIIYWVVKQYANTADVPG
jgi:hypothetical protein